MREDGMQSWGRCPPLLAITVPPPLHSAPITVSPLAPHARVRMQDLAARAEQLRTRLAALEASFAALCGPGGSMAAAADDADALGSAPPTPGAGGEGVAVAGSHASLNTGVYGRD